MSDEMDYSDSFKFSNNENPTKIQIIKRVIDFFYGPDSGRFNKGWNKRIVRLRPRLMPVPISAATTPRNLTHFYEAINPQHVHGPSARIPYPIIILGGVLILAVFYLILFLTIHRLRCCKKNQQQTTRRRNRQASRQTDGLYHIEEDVLGSGTAPPYPKLAKFIDLPPSYEDAILASGFSHQQLAEAKTNQVTPSNVNDEVVELNQSSIS